MVRYTDKNGNQVTYYCRRCGESISIEDKTRWRRDVRGTPICVRHGCQLRFKSYDKNILEVEQLRLSTKGLKKTLHTMTWDKFYHRQR